MPKKTLWECDGCGKSELEENTKEWLEAEVRVGKHGTEPVLTCSFACLGRYAVRREEEHNH